MDVRRGRRWLVAVLTVAVLPMASIPNAAWAQTSAPPPQRTEPVAGKPYQGPEVERARVLLEKRLAVQDFVPGQVVVQLKPGMLPAGGAMPAWLSTMASGGGVRRTSGDELVISVSGTALAPLSAGDRIERTRELVRRLALRPEVAWVQPNYRFQIARAPGDPRYAEQWHYQARAGAAPTAPGGIGLPGLWDRTTGSRAVVVAVLDTGILPNHPDIQGSGNLLDGFDLVSDAAVGADGDGRDPDPTDPGDAVTEGECGDFLGLPVPDRDVPSSWHGSHVAGTIGVGRSNDTIGVAGIAWQVGVLPVRVLGKCGGSMTDIADAIRWAAALPVPGVPANPTKAQVINLSLGGRGECRDSPAMQNAIDDARSAGVLVVVAAGNEGEDAAGFTPASCNGVLTVAAADRNGRLASRYSNFGAAVDLLAPGGDVAQDADGDGRPDGVLSYVDGGYAYYNGTSMAAPHVAGVAALLLARRPDMTPIQLEGELRSHARPRSPSECSRPCGAGLLDADFEPAGLAPTPGVTPVVTPVVTSIPTPRPTATPTPPAAVPALGAAGWLLVAAGGALAARARTRRNRR